MTTEEMRKNIRIGVLMGGVSNEREVSLITGDAIHKALLRLGYRSRPIVIDGIALDYIDRDEIDLAYIALHGAFGEDGSLQGALDILKIPYTSSGARASAVAMDKVLTKDIYRALGGMTPECRIVTEADKGRFDFTGPVALKPRSGGSSIGITLVMDEAALPTAIEAALREDSEAIAEEYIEGKLITIGALGGRALPAIEIELDEGFYDYANKYKSGKSRYLIPPRLDESVLATASEMTLKLHARLGCRGATRSEFIVDKENRVWFLELNTIPGMTVTSLLPKAAAAVGISFDRLVEMILLEALGR